MSQEITLQRASDLLVRKEVLCCLSGLVATLASAAGYTLHPVGQPGSQALSDLSYRAMELASPVLDYETAAREAGWTAPADGGLWTITDGRDENYTADSAEEACRLDDIEPHELEVYEHWSVAGWLADQLEARGEKVDRDFAGLTVWARTTTGQAIRADCVIRDVVKATGYATFGEISAAIDGDTLAALKTALPYVDLHCEHLQDDARTDPEARAELDEACKTADAIRAALAKTGA